MKQASGKTLYDIGHIRCVNRFLNYDWLDFLCKRETSGSSIRQRRWQGVSHPPIEALVPFSGEPFFSKSVKAQMHYSAATNRSGQVAQFGSGGPETGALYSVVIGVTMPSEKHRSIPINLCRQLCSAQLWFCSGSWSHGLGTDGEKSL